MQIVHIHQQRAEHAFAEKAAAAFAGDPEMTSFTDGEIAPGVLLALRWGSHKRAVLVLRLDEIHQPTIYADLVDGLDDVPF